MRRRIALLVLGTVGLLPSLLASPAIAAPEGATIDSSSLFAELGVSATAPGGYNRALFEHWVDSDGDGCDTRQEVLIEESRTPVTFTSSCSVASGEWYSSYDGATWTAPGNVDIDHLVPLAEAWRSGAAGWSPEQRRAFANDLGIAAALVAVTDNVNQSKGDSDPAQWLPPLTATHCSYIVDWIVVKYRWALTVDPAEQSTILNLLSSNSCGSQLVTVPARVVVPAVDASTVRFTGADRYEVAINIAREYAPGVPVMYIAKGTDYPDALSAAPAATAAGGPLLLTLPNTLLPKVRAEIQRLQPERIVAVGGPASITPNVFAELQGLAPTVVQVGGVDRYDASRNLVTYAFADTGATRVYVATGANFPDALSASAAAGAIGGAVLLVNGRANELDRATANTIIELNPIDAVIAGGPNSVFPGIESGLNDLNLPQGAQRLGGADRYEAGRNINQEAFTSATRVYLATGLNFPDALAGAALAGRNSAPLYIVPGNCVPFDVVNDINGFGQPQLNILGGPNSVGPAVESLLPCAATPGISVTNSCASGAFVGVTNSNPFDISLEVDFDFNRDGSPDAGDGGYLVAAQSSQTFNVGRFNEDTAQDVIVSFRGSVINRTTVRVDCVTPPPPPPPQQPANPGDTKNCSDFPTYAAAKAWFDTYYPYYGDVARLDQNNDLRPCENLPGGPGR